MPAFEVRFVDLDHNTVPDAISASRGVSRLDDDVLEESATSLHQRCVLS